MTTKEKKDFDKEHRLQAKTYFNTLKKLIIKEWGRSALNDLEVTKIGKALLNSKYKGTYPQDKLPFKPGYFIINVDHHGFPGSHWCAVFVSNKNMYIYDSFARPSKKLLPYLYETAKKKGYKIINVNGKSDQKKNSQVCGPISVAWLKAVDRYGIESARHI